MNLNSSLINGDINHDWQRCQAPRCGKFVSSDRNQGSIYCSPKCNRRASAQRRRDRKNAAKTEIPAEPEKGLT